MSLRTPLSRARGYGSAKEGTHHWWMQRVTSIALVPLTLWFIIALATVLLDADYFTVKYWIGHPFNTAMLVLLVVTSVYHTVLGMQVVIEDYIHHEWAKIATLLVVKFILWLLAAVAVVAVLRIAFLGAEGP